MQHRSRKLPAAAIDVCAALLVDACGNATSIAFDSSEDHSPESARDLFEILVVRGIRTCLSVMPGAANKNGYYHDEKGVEADIVVELSDGRWAAIEVKLSENMVDEDAAARLLYVASKLTSNPREQVRPPEFLTFVVGKGSRAYCRSDGIYVLSVAALQQ